MKLNNQLENINKKEQNILIELIEDKIEDRERALSLCEGLESERYIRNIKIELVNLNRLLTKIKNI